MSPTIFRQHGLRFYFFSLEESRIHVHVDGAKGEAKFWLEPHIELASNEGLSTAELRRARSAIVDHEDEIRAAWRKRREA